MLLVHLSPLQIASVKGFDQEFGGGQVGRDRDIVDVADPEDVLAAGFLIAPRERVS